MMKETYSRITTTKVIGYLTRNDNGDFVVEVYDKKDEEPIVVSVEEMLRDMEGMQVSFISEQVN